MSQTPKRQRRTASPERRPGQDRDREPRQDLDQDQAVRPVPLRLNLAAGVATLEGLAVAAWGVATAFDGGHDAVPAGLLVLLLAALPLGAAYGLHKARRWSRGPALIMQLLSLPIAWAMLGSGGPVVPGGIALGVLAVTGLVLLVHPATSDALGIRRTASS